MRGRRSVHVLHAQRWHIQGKPGVLERRRRGSRSRRTKGARREIRGVQHAGHNNEEQHRDRGRSENRLVQGHRGKYSGCQPTPMKRSDSEAEFEVVDLQKLQNKRRQGNGTTDARTRATSVTNLRFAARSQAAPGTRLVLPELPRGYLRRRHAPRAAWNGKRSAGDDGPQLLGASLRVPQPWPS